MTPIFISSFLFLLSALFTENFIFIVFVICFPILYVGNVYFRYRRYGLTNRWRPENKVVLITGASSGIGESLAYQFAKNKSILFLVARRAEMLLNVGKRCEELGATQVITIKTDVTEEEEIVKLIETIETTFNRLDCLILNAGVSMGETLESIKSFQIIRSVMDVNFYGSAILAYHAIPLLKRSDKSRIVVVSSVIGLTPVPLRTGYAASKFALRGFFESLQHELIDSNIFITIAYPGVVLTEINKNRLGKNPKYLNTKGGMESEECSRIIFESTCNGDKEVLFTNRDRLIRLVEGIFPHLLFYMVKRISKDLFEKENKDD